MKSLSQNSNGAALLTVLVALMIITLMLFEFQFRTEVERRLAYNDLDRIRAYYLAKSAANIGLLRIGLYGRALNSPAVQNNKTMNVQQYLDKIWSLSFPAFPPTLEEIKDLETRAEKSSAEKILKQTKVADGRFYSVIQSESSKINLNFLIVPKDLLDQPPNFSEAPKALHEHVGRLLINLIENFMKESEDPYEEYGDIKPDEIVLDIMDWVNAGDERFGGGAKDAFYERQVPPYKAKRNRFYTVDELRLVKGIDERLFAKLKPYVTVHSYAGRININEARDNVLKAIYPDLNDEDLKQLNEYRRDIQGFTSASQFVTYIADTLNRPGIKEYYDKPEDYPFTVSNEGFVIQATGVIEKSASSVQSRIDVAVSLNHQSRGGQKAPAHIKPADCKGPYYLDKRNNQCTYLPTTEEECTGMLAGEWQSNGTQYCCILLKPPQTLCPPAAGTGAPGGTSGSGGTATTEPPNAMKILTWMES